MTNLFSPLSLRGVDLRNRIVVSPMWQYVGTDGYPTDWHLMHLGRYADGGAGIVFQEGTAVERRGCGTVGDIGIWDDKFVGPLRRLTSMMRDNGAVPAIQLAHAGRKSRTKRPMDGRGPLERTDDIPDWEDWEPISASAVPLKAGLNAPRPMSTQDIHDVTQAYVDAARRSEEAGYDVLELHAAHGYLFHQFLSEVTNQRGDGYGGSFSNRIRFLLEVVEAVREVWHDDKPLFVRLSCIDGAGWNMNHTIDLTRRLLALGVDVIDCSTGGLVGSPLKAGESPSYGYQVPYSQQLRESAGARTMAVGLIVHAEHANEIISSGQADLVAIAREALHNPNWPLDAALKLGVDQPYSVLAPTSGYWLAQRARAVPDLQPSTLPSR